MKKEFGIKVKEEEDKLSGSVEVSVGDKDLSGFLKGKYGEGEKGVSLGLRSSGLGEFGISCENNKPIEAYYKPSEKVKAWGYGLSLVLGFGVGIGVSGFVPEPYKLPVALAVGAIISGFCINKISKYKFMI
jgi:hypothetical protein